MERGNLYISLDGSLRRYECPWLRVDGLKFDLLGLRFTQL